MWIAVVGNDELFFAHIMIRQFCKRKKKNSFLNWTRGVFSHPVFKQSRPTTTGYCII